MGWLRRWHCFIPGFLPSFIPNFLPKLCGSVFALTLAASARGSLQPLPRLTRLQPLEQSERKLTAAAWHVSEFSPDDDPRLGKCRIARSPEPLLTPDPRLPLAGDSLEIRVSIIIGLDGRVQSPFVLDSAEPFEADRILRSIHSWRYRPALCNGVPTDSEAVIRFIVP